MYMFSSFDTNQFFNSLDHMVGSQPDQANVEDFFKRSMSSAIDSSSPIVNQLTVLNEEIGFFRSRGEHTNSTAAARLALGLLENPDNSDDITPTVTFNTIINAATAYRAAHLYDRSLPLYQQALGIADSETMTGHSSLPTRSVASLHNNLSILYSDTDEPQKALDELEKALFILEAEKNPVSQHDLLEEIGSTHSNMALVLLDLRRYDDAREHAQKADELYVDNGFNVSTPHYAAILSTLAQCETLAGKPEQAKDHYSKALAIITNAYGKSSDQYAAVSANLETVNEILAAAATDSAVPSGAGSENSAAVPAGSSATDSVAPVGSAAAVASSIAPSLTPLSGLEIARKYWEQFGKPLIHKKYPQLEGRIAAGLVGHGSEKYGFDDEFSRDHDFGPGFCWWLTAEDYAQFGKQLQHDYDKFPHEFMGVSAEPSRQTPRTQGARKRTGVFSIPEFFESLTGLSQAPSTEGDADNNDNLLWLSLSEPTLSAATNGEVFADPLGAFSSVRQGFKRLPKDVGLCMVSQRLGMMAQAGQYNFPRMMKRGDAHAAQLCMTQFAQATISLVFLVNSPMIAGYMPYYKWQFAALRKLSRRMGMLLTDVCEPLEKAMDSSVNNPKKTEGFITQIARSVVRELRKQGMTQISDDFLEWHRPYVEELISDSRLKSL
jgi:tetratricopeptide (TPR) repeat protein